MSEKQKQDVYFDDDARSPLIKGIDKVANSVKVTLGPRGKLVLLASASGSKFTKDGVSVARKIQLTDLEENEGAKLIIETAAKSNSRVGDGTTTSTLLAQAMIHTGYESLQQGSNLTKIKLGMDLAAEDVKKYLKKIKSPIRSKTQIRNIATISGNDPLVGILVAEAFEAAGRKGVVSFEPTRATPTATLETVKGTRFDRGYAVPLVNNYQKQTAEYQNNEGVHILMTSQRLDNVQEVSEVLQRWVKSKGPIAPLVIIAEEFSADVIEFLAFNHAVKQSITICPVRTPLYGELRNDLMEDLAILTGATFITPQKGISLKSLDVEKHLGKAKKIVASIDTTTIIEGFGKPETIQEYVKGLSTLMENSASPADKASYKERIGKIVGGVSLIKVGGQTDSEIKERIDRFEDAVNATSVAIESGLLPGGGVALLGASYSLDSTQIQDKDVQLGYEIIKNAILQPFRTILGNGNIPFEGHEKVISEKLKENPNYGMDLRNESYGDMIKMGVVDPYMVTISALEAALSITSLVLNTAALVPYELPKSN